MIEIEIEKLKSDIIILLSKLNEKKGGILSLDKDYYWYIESEDMYNPYTQPQDLSLGQLSHDWEHVKALTEDVMIPNDLNKIAGLLKAISEEYSIAF